MRSSNLRLQNVPSPIRGSAGVSERVIGGDSDGVSSYPKCLSIGAPSSPTLSNLMLYRLDTRLVRAATTANVIYTRYADDITVSGESVENVERFETLATQIIKSTRS